MYIKTKIFMPGAEEVYIHVVMDEDLWQVSWCLKVQEEGCFCWHLDHAWQLLKLLSWLLIAVRARNN